MKKITLVGITLLIAAAALISLMRHYEPPPIDTLTHGSHLRGVDVSHHQGRIDWSELAGHDISFAFIKATEGGDWTDPRFEENWLGAKRAGVLPGAYHFFTLCRDAREQAEHFLTIVGDMEGALLPALDAEQMGQCRDGPTMQDVAGGVLTFLDTVHGAIGTRPVIYTTKTFYAKHLDGKTPGERFWLRALIAPPGFGPEDWMFWQYSDNGRRRGIGGAVDLNLFAGDTQDMDQLRVR